MLRHLAVIIPICAALVAVVIAVLSAPLWLGLAMVA